jgi:hypothetical protein
LYEKDSTVCEKKAENIIPKFRYKNIILLSNGQICNADINQTNGNIFIKFDTCDKLKNWYNKKIISIMDYSILKNFMPPKTKSANLLNGLYIQGVSGYQANLLTTTPFLKMKGVLFKKEPGYHNYIPVKYYFIDTFSVIRNKVKTAENIIDKYSFYIRAYAKKIYSDTNYNPYVFKYSLSSLFYSDSEEPFYKKAVFLPGVSYYNLDTSLLVSLPNTLKYKEINGKTIDEYDNCPVNNADGTHFDSIYYSLYNPNYKNDVIYNLDEYKDKIYAQKNDENTKKLKSFDTIDWNSNQHYILYALLRLGRYCKFNPEKNEVNDVFNNSICQKYLWFHKNNKTSPLSLTYDFFNKLYLRNYQYIYDNTDFKGFKQYGVVDMNIKQNEITGEKEATINLETIHDFYKKMFHLDSDKDISSKENPFFGKYIYYPGTNKKYDILNLTMLFDNTSNINYGVPLINKDTVSIYNGYSISFGIPYVIDYFDDKVKKSVIPGLFIKVYSTTVVE